VAQKEVHEVPVLASADEKIVVERDPWVISMHGVVLRQAESFGFLTELPDGRFGTRPLPPSDADPPPSRAWYRATEVLEESRSDLSYAAVLATDHPRSITANLEVVLAQDGTVSVGVSVPGAMVCQQEFEAVDGERFLGFGERSHAVSIDRGVIENYVGEGPFQPHEYPFLVDAIPAWGIRNRPDATYFPIPWVLSTRGYGLLVDRDEVSYVRVRQHAQVRWSVEVESDRLDYRLFGGPTPLEVLSRFTAATGRQPEPERWWFGPWYQSGHANHVPLDEESRQLEVLRSAGAGVSAVETHCRYLPLGEDRGYEEDERARTALFHAHGMAALSYLNPMVGEEYSEAFRSADSVGALIRDQAGSSYLFQGYVGGRQPPHTMESLYDFTNPEARGAWQRVAERLVAAGYDGWMEDFGEYVPLDAVASDGSTGTAGHNRYPAHFHSAAAAVATELERRTGRRLARFARSGWKGSAAVTPIVWGGDPTTSWGFDGLRSALIEGLSMGASGIATWGSDTGGFFSTVDRLTPELLVRWIQFSAFCPVMRTKSSGIEAPVYERPQIWDDDVLPSWVRWSCWHTRLNDYLMAAHEVYRRTGRPIMCSLELLYPEMGPIDDEYLLGADLLVAPILDEGATARRVRVPAGRWFHLFDPFAQVDGPIDIEMEAGLDEITVLVRAGAVIGLLPDGSASLSPYAPPPEAHRQVLAFPFPEADHSGLLGPGLDHSTHWNGDRWTLNLRVLSPATYDRAAMSWDVSVRTLTAPAAGEVEGAESWDWEGGWLRCRLEGGSPAVTIRVTGVQP
jgi:sulfoquinovosidase